MLEGTRGAHRYLMIEVEPHELEHVSGGIPWALVGRVAGPVSLAFAVGSAGWAGSKEYRRGGSWKDVAKEAAWGSVGLDKDNWKSLKTSYREMTDSFRELKDTFR